MAEKQNRQTFDEFQEDKVLWSDRKRWLGMPLTFTKYTVDENRLYVKRGFFRTTVEETLLYRILDIKSSAGFGQKICGVGTVTLFCNDQSNPVLELKNIKKPEKVRRFLSQTIEAKRHEKGVAGRELYGSVMGGPPPRDDGPDDFPEDMPSFDELPD